MKRSYNLRRPTFYYLSIFIFLVFSFSLQAQVEITGGNQNPWTPQNLIENVFLGEGVEVTNITYSGVDAAVGYFQNGLADVGLERGIIMTSGNAIDGLGPNDASGNGTNNNSTASCPELNQLTTFNLFNVAAYEITFIPVNDTLRFRYVFASEEYPEYACSSFNDVFGFFITGPNPAGGDYVAENIALIPDLADPTGLTFTNNPVTINNVNNQGVNPGAGCNFDFGAYYNDNSGSQNLQYDGYLDAFTAQAIVIPCQPYTIKLAVSDAGDGIFDTAVFLEAKSFGTGALEVTAQTVSLDGTLVEGCADGELCFKLPSEAESDIQLDYTLIGNAINGVDYEMIPLDLFIAAGDSMVCYPIIPIDDGIAEGIDSIGIDVQIDPCTRDTFWVFIKDPALPELVLPPDTTICKGDSVYVDGTLPITLPDPPTFTNNTSIPVEPANTAVYSDIFVSGVFPIELQDGVIKQVCIDSFTHKWDDDMDFFLFSPGGQFIELSTDNGQNCDNYINTCFTPGATLTLQDIVPIGTVCPGGQEAGFSGDFQIEGIWEDLWDGGSPTNGTWRLFMLDDSDGFAGDLHSWTICFNPLYQVSYSWTPAAGLSCADCPNPWMSPDTTTTYILTATDTYGCTTEDTITIFVDDVLPAPMVDCGTITSNSITFTWNDVGGATGGYQVNVNGQGWIPANGTLEHTVSGLALNQTVTIEVQGIADCNGEIGTVTCMTPDCPAPTGSVSNIVNNNCFGDTDGSATVIGMGANPPFTYQMDGMTDADGIFENLAAGSYDVLVIDNVNCGVTVSFTITEPDSLQSISIIEQNISCNGEVDGQGTVTLMGGTAPYTFVWSTGSTDSVALDLVAGQNFVTVTDALGCQVVDMVEITEPDVLGVSVAGDLINCFGGTDGNAVATPTGGTEPYTYLWNDGQDDDVANNLSAQTYTVQVTDANGCTAMTSVTLDQNPTIDLSNTSSTLASCNGVQDGTATVSPSGGGGNFTYQWEVIGNQTTQTALGLTVGTYTVTVTDQLGCTASTTVAVSSPNAITAGFTSTPALCFDSSDGQAEVTVQGGTPDPNLPEGYTFDWSAPGGNGSIHNDLPSGIHFVTITDANFCFEVVEIEVFAPDEIQLSLNANNVNCASGTDGEASVGATGGAGGFTYQWTGGTNPNDPNVIGLPAGWVYVTVEDANGCTKTDSIEVTAPNAIVLTTDNEAVDCNGNNSGTATVNASNGAGNFTYLWSDPNAQTTSTAIDLLAGSYTVTVTDANLCTATTEVQVTEPDLLTSAIGGNDANCFGETNGDATVAPAGGSMGYIFNWSNGSSDATATSLGAGDYTVTVTDANGCSTINSITIGSPTALTLTTNGLDVNCFGENNGSATANAGGGEGNYSYQWSDSNSQNTMTANSLIAGNYFVTVTDGNGCEIVESILINQPSELIIFDENITNVDCNGSNSGAIDLDIQGGVAPYNYNWSTGANTQDLNSLSVGTYTLTVTDVNLCEAIQTYSLNEPSVLELSFTNVNVDCFNGNDGSIDLTVTGGAPGSYTLTWTGPNGFSSSNEDISSLTAGDYTVTAVDANGCSISQVIAVTQPLTGVSTTISDPEMICFGSTDGTATVTATGGTPPYNYLWNDQGNQDTPTANNLAPGTYIVTVTDQSGCTFTETAQVIEQPEISIMLSQSSALCHDSFDGTATIDNILYGNVPGNMSDFNIQWNTTPGQSGATANNLQGGGSYEVTVSNDLGCTAIANIVVDNPEEVAAMIAESTDVICFDGNDGTARAEGTGGIAPYSYLWSPNANSQNTALAANLQQGNYVVTISDVNGCTSTAAVQIDEPEELEIDDFTRVNVECFGENTGVIVPDVRGGNLPYSYAWSNGATTASADQLAAGTYGLTITDGNGCTVESTAIISQPDAPLTATADADDVSCAGGFDGEIFLFPSGGTQPYMYSTDGINFNGSPTQIGIIAGNYTNVTVQDANGCKVQLPPISVSELPQVEVDLGPDTTIIYGESIFLNAVVTNATGTVSYDWLPSDDRHLSCNNCPPPVSVDSLSQQMSYQVIVTDENGCTASDIITIFVKKFREVLVPTGFSPNGDGNMNDLLVVHGRPGSTVKLFRVYDRWGELMYENRDYLINDFSTGWDGTHRGQPMNPGVYVWYAEVEFEDGAVKTFKGQTTLIR